MGSVDDLDSLRAERDLYRALLDLGAHDDLAAFLDEALGLIATVTGASRGYLSVHPRGAREDAGLHIARGAGPDDVARIREEISSGIIAESLRTGRTVSTASAREDPRYSNLTSVQAQRIEAVLCAPIGGVEGIGVLYLQGRAAPGPFTERDRAMVDTFALRIAPFAERLLARTRDDEARRDHTAELRARLRVDRLVGTSRAMADALKQLAVASRVDATVLIDGESGTGKTEFARALHDSSGRASGPFVEVNCAALPETLFESELFGAEKGAHSTATRRMTGKIDAARGGTLFLDEVGEIPLALQPKLLQFLQSRRFYRLGGDAPVDADVRVIAATNVDLARAVKERRFRDDLYYRLNVLAIHVPALRERTEDIGMLADRIATEASRAVARAVPLTYAARAALTASEWPGNVRQLASSIQRGLAFAIEEGADAIDVSHLFPDRPANEAAPVTWQDGLRHFQKQLLRDALDACDGNVSEAARRLGLARSHLHELLRSHGLGRARGG